MDGVGSAWEMIVTNMGTSSKSVMRQHIWLFAAFGCLYLSSCTTVYQFGGLHLESSKGTKVHGDYIVDDDVPRLSEKRIGIHFKDAEQMELLREQFKIKTAATKMMEKTYIGKAKVVLTLKTVDGSIVFRRSYRLTDDGEVLAE